MTKKVGSSSPRSLDPSDQRLDNATEQIIGDRLRALLKPIVDEPVPERFIALLDAALKRTEQ